MNIEHVRQAMLQKHAFDWGSAGKVTGDFLKRLATAKVMPNLSLGTRVGIGAGFAGGLMAPKALKYVANKADQAGVDLGEWYFEEDNEKEKARQEALDRQIERTNRLLAQREELNARKATDAVTQKQIAEQKANLAGAGAGGYGTNYLMSNLNKDKFYSTLAGKQASVATPANVAPAVPGASAFGNARAWLKKRKALKEPVSAPKAVATQPDNNQVKSASAEQLPLAHRVLLSLAVNGMPRPE